MSFSGVSGHFTASELWRMHARWAASHGRDPMTPVRLGLLLGEYGAIRKPKWDLSKTSPERAASRGQRGQMVKGWIL
jgi:hypothetical protein